MDERQTVERLTEAADSVLAEMEPGKYVDVGQHSGRRATDADIAARDEMVREAQRIRPAAIFVSEDSDQPDDIPYPSPGRPSEVLLADPCDGSRQHGQLGFGYASCVSLHTFGPENWWDLDAASITVSGKTASWARRDGLLMGVGGNTDASTDLREHTSQARVRIPPCIAVGASSATGIPLLVDLMNVRDPEVDPLAAGEDPYLRVWNTAGNPITPGLLRSHTMVAVQLNWSTQWDTLFAFFASVAGLAVYPLVWHPEGKQRPIGEDRKPLQMNPFERRLWWGRPRWNTFDRKCIPPIVVGPDEPYTHEIYNLIQASTYVQRKRPVQSEDERLRFVKAMRRDLGDLQNVPRGYRSQ